MRYAGAIAFMGILAVLCGCSSKEVEVEREATTLEERLEGMSEEEKRKHLEQIQQQQEEMGYMFEDFMKRDQER